MLWRIGEPPILFIVVLFQWSQASIKIFDANFRGITLQEFYRGWTIDDAVWLSLIGILFLAVGIKLSLNGMKYRKGTDFMEEVSQLSIKNIWYCYLVFSVTTLGMQDFLLAFSGTRQAFLVILQLKWVIVYLLAISIIGQKRNYFLLTAVFMIELLIGVTGFFSTFQDVIIVFILSYLTYIYIYTRKVVVITLAAFVLLTSLLVVWSAVKAEYRDHISLGTGEQRAFVSTGERLDKILSLVASLDKESLIQGIENFASRAAYVDYFARVIEFVPNHVPHEDGAMWGSALYHVLTPRILFPDKAALELDTLTTERYTGYQLVLQGGSYTNVPLGYMTESYIDFGPVYMFLPILGLGLVIGVIYRNLTHLSGSIVFGYGASIAVLMGARQLEMTSTKLIGGLLMGFIIMALVQKLLFPKLARALSVKERAA
ncbi:hypothetical protein ACFL1S_01110 [Pseudomonadota bacterium]